MNNLDEEDSLNYDISLGLDVHQPTNKQHCGEWMLLRFQQKQTKYWPARIWNRVGRARNCSVENKFMFECIIFK